MKNRTLNSSPFIIVLLSFLGTSLSAGTITGKVSARSAKYRRDVLVYLKKVPGAFPAPTESVVMDQKNLKFEPHILPIVNGTKVGFLNSDDVAHNVFSPDREKYNLGTWPQGEQKYRTFKCDRDLCVYAQLCNVHPEMEGYVVVLQNPYFATTDRSGSFRIENVPPGEYTIAVWSSQGRVKAKDQSVTVSGAETTVEFELKR